MFNGTYKGKRVLVTGHTGFKGSWLTAWLLSQDAEVYGISKDTPTVPAMYQVTKLEDKLTSITEDIRNTDAIVNLILEIKPDFIFHLAAQAIVSISYTSPAETVTSNVIGTMSILEALRKAEFPCASVIITSDKCYDNVEWVWGYRETDALGGKDIYSGSKGAAELIIKSYFHSFLAASPYVRLAIGRAGNVIGGGDWAKDRILADCVRAWSKEQSVEIRCPAATRPWQHVLEPLSGYLHLGAALAKDFSLNGEAFNFGPKSEQNRTVIELISDVRNKWKTTSKEAPYVITDNRPFHEAGLLKLNCDKALLQLKWEPNLDYNETIEMVGDWYNAYYHDPADMLALTQQQIANYESLATRRGRVWAK